MSSRFSHIPGGRADLPGQLELPGAGAEPLRVTLARKAVEPLKPSAPQEPPPRAGLFSDSRDQLDLVSVLHSKSAIGG